MRLTPSWVSVELLSPNLWRDLSPAKLLARYFHSMVSLFSFTTAHMEFNQDIPPGLKVEKELKIQINSTVFSKVCTFHLVLRVTMMPARAPKIISFTLYCWKLFSTKSQSSIIVLLLLKIFIGARGHIVPIKLLQSTSQQQTSNRVEKVAPGVVSTFRSPLFQCL